MKGRKKGDSGQEGCMSQGQVLEGLAEEELYGIALDDYDFLVTMVTVRWARSTYPARSVLSSIYSAIRN